MRILVIAFTNIEYTIELTEALSKLEDVLLMIPEKQVERFSNVLNPNLNVHALYCPRLRHPANLLMLYLIIRKINNFKPDIIHIQRGHPWFNFILPFLKRYPIITTIHDVVLHSGDKESSRIPVFTHNLAIRYAQQIIVHGKKLKEEMIEEYKKPPGVINVLPRGTNSIYKRYIDKSVDEEDDSILFFGRIWEYKGLRYLIEAEPLITDQISNAKIVIAGRGEDVRKKYYDIMVHRDKFIIYNEHISNEMVAELFQKASIAVFPYTDASQSGVIPLAYAFRKPVVITCVGSLPEVVDHGETGYIVPPRNSAKLAEAIIDLLKDPVKRKRMGENAYHKAQKDLSWDTIAAKTVDVYRMARNQKASDKKL